MKTTLLLSLLFFATPDRCAADDVWVFSGQSNMKAIGGEARAALGELVKSHGRAYLPIFVAEPGKPIEAWLDPEHKDHPKLWGRLEAEINKARAGGHRFRGFVWYQGESNVKDGAGRYQGQLAELVKRVRRLSGEAELPAVVVQLAAATSYAGTDRAVGALREAQRRFVEDDGHAALVAAIDAEVGDYTVHLSRAGSEVVAARIAAAADRLAYGTAGSHWGPQFKLASFASSDRRRVVVEFDEVREALDLRDGWLAGFEAELPGGKFAHPTGGRALGGGKLALAFARPLPSGVKLNYAATRNAQHGPHRRWGLEFGGVRDGSGHQAPAFAGVPVEKASTPIDVGKIAESPGLRADWRQLAVNCVGRYPEAVTEPKALAGAGEAGWRQPFWNPASAGEVPNLFDAEGRVTPVSFHTGVWYMSPHFRELNSADDALMAGWCKHSLHGFSGLEPGAEYAVAVYLLQGPPKGSDAAPSHVPVRVSALHIPPGKKRKHAEVVAERTVRVPATGRFGGYVIAGDEGNVVTFEGIRADAEGRIGLTVETSTKKGGRVRWSDATLAGVQLRAASE